MDPLPVQGSPDTVFLRGLNVSAVVGREAWHRPNRAQPVLLHLRVQHDLASAGQSDDVRQTINYGTLCKAVTEAVECRRSSGAAGLEGPSFEDLAHLATEVCRTALSSGGAGVVRLAATLPDALLLADGGITLSMLGRLDPAQQQVATAPRLQTLGLSVHGLAVTCIVGVNPHERLEKQRVLIDLTLADFAPEVCRLYAAIVKAVSDVSSGPW